MLNLLLMDQPFQHFSSHMHSELAGFKVFHIFPSLRLVQGTSRSLNEKYLFRPSSSLCLCAMDRAALATPTLANELTFSVSQFSLAYLHINFHLDICISIFTWMFAYLLPSSPVCLVPPWPTLPYGSTSQCFRSQVTF